MSSSSQLPCASLKKKIQAAQSKCLDFAKCTTPATRDMLKAYAGAVGCPPEYIFFPLLTTCCSFMGASSCVKINETWTEPAILWTVVVARKGEKKSAALKPLLTAVEEIEAEAIKKWEADTTADCSGGNYQFYLMYNGIEFFIIIIDTRDRRRSASQLQCTPSGNQCGAPQLLVEQFSFEQLHTVMANNKGAALGLYDEMSTMYEQLDVYKHAGSRQDRSTLLKLYSGSSWARTFRSVSARVPHTQFNMSGFIQPGLIFEQLYKSDVDGFNDRQLFDSPAEIDPLYEQLKAVPANTISLKALLEQIKKHHDQSSTEAAAYVYQLSKDGMAVFTGFHDEIVLRRSLVPDDENRRGVLSKAKGQLARIALALHVLEEALQQLEPDPQTNKDWSFVIEDATLQRAVELINHFVEQKFTLMRPEEKYPTCSPELSQLSDEQRHFLDCNAVWLRKLLQSQHQSLTPSIVSQLRLMPPCSTSGDDATPGLMGKTKYPASEAKKFLTSVSHLGLGTMHAERHERLTAKGPVLSKTSTKFRKRKFSELEPTAQAILKHLRVSQGRSQDLNFFFCGAESRRKI